MKVRGTDPTTWFLDLFILVIGGTAVCLVHILYIDGQCPNCIEVIVLS